MESKSEIPILYHDNFRDIHVQNYDFLKFVGGFRALK